VKQEIRKVSKHFFLFLKPEQSKWTLSV